VEFETVMQGYGKYILRFAYLKKKEKNTYSTSVMVKTAMVDTIP